MTSAAALKERGGHVRALMGLGVDVVALRAWQGGGRGDGAGGRVARGAAGDVLQDASGDVSQGAVSRVLDLRQGLVHLMQKHGVSEVLVEGGGVLHGQLLAQGLVDQMLVFVGGRVIGDERARSGVAGLDCATMAQAGHARLQGVKAVGGDVLMDWRVGGVA